MKLYKYPLLFIVLLFTFVVFFHSDGAILQDLGRHLTLGKIIWQTREIPGTNLFSYTYPEFPVIDHHWGSQVLFYLVEAAFSINGLIILKVCLVMAAVSFISFFSVRRADGLAYLISGFLAVEILRDRTQIRPEIFAFLFFAIFLVILYREKEKPGNWIWLLPFAEILWINLHISFVYGLAVFGCFALDRIFKAKFRKQYLYIGLALAVSVLINPYGVNGALYPFRIFQNYGYSIVENQSVVFLSSMIKNNALFYFKISTIIFLGVLPLLIFGKKYFELLTAGFLLILSWLAVRHFPFFAISLIYPASLGISYLLEKIKEKKIIPEENFQLVQIFSVLVMVIFILWEIYLTVSNKYYYVYSAPVRFGLGQVSGEKGALDYFLANNLKGPIYNSFDNGSYLIYRLYPGERVFVDGRPEAYPADFFQKTYIPMQEKEEVWQEIDRKYKFQTIIFPHTDATPWAKEFIKRIIKDGNWKVEYLDDYSLVLSRRPQTEKDSGSQNLAEIKKQGQELMQKINQQDGLNRLGNFFNLIGLTIKS
ncbi:hypothetical protein MUP32_06760 [Candidatus Microgenomates bacterium]|nr:hypothetical protein [Candidatus Microgenomates bacterium]